MPKQRDGLIQLFNADNDPFYVELWGARAFWLIPSQYTFADVKYLTHLTEDGNCYYEHLPTSEVSWVLPPDAMMAHAARNRALSYIRMTRDKLEIALLEPFPEEESVQQMEQLDAFFESPKDETEENAEEEEGQDEIEVDLTPIRRKSRTNRESPAHTEGERSSDESDAENALATINDKKGRRSGGGTSGEESDGGSGNENYSALFKSVQGVFENESGKARPLSMAITLKTVESVQETTIKVVMLFDKLPNNRCLTYVLFLFADWIPNEARQEVQMELEEALFRADAVPHCVLRERQSQSKDQGRDSGHGRLANHAGHLRQEVRIPLHFQ